MATALLAEGATATCTRRARWARRRPFAVKKMIRRTPRAPRPSSRCACSSRPDPRRHRRLPRLDEEGAGQQAVRVLDAARVPRTARSSTCSTARAAAVERQPRLEQPRLLRSSSRWSPASSHMRAARRWRTATSSSRTCCARTPARCALRLARARPPCCRRSGHERVVEQEEAISKYSPLMYRAPRWSTLPQARAGPKVDGGRSAASSTPSATTTTPSPPSRRCRSSTPDSPSRTTRHITSRRRSPR